MIDEDLELDNGPAGLRKELKKEKTLRRELEERLARLEAQNTGTNIRQALSRRGLNPEVAKFYPADRPATETSVDEWVDENRDLFGFREKPKAPANESEIPSGVQEGYKTLKALQAAEEYTEMDLRSKLMECEDEAAVLELMKSYVPPMG